MKYRLANFVFAIVVLVLLAGGGFGAYWQWHARHATAAGESAQKPAVPLVDGAVPVRISPQARKNLELTAKPLELTTYWRKIEVPGVVTERPGVSDRGVVAPVT